jgi:hypothetical protein
MPVIEGTISGSIRGFTVNIPTNIKSISLVNKTGGSITASIAIQISGHERYIRSEALAANAGYYDDPDILLLAGCEIIVVSSGQLDYYITTE